MPLKLYMDHHVPRAVTMSLRLRHVDVITAYEDKTHEIADADLLDRATYLRRALFTQDDDLLVEATRRQRNGRTFGGVIYAHQENVSIGHIVQDLEIIATVGSEADIINWVI